MSTQAVLLPLLVQVALTFALGFWMAIITRLINPLGGNGRPAK